LGTTSSGCLTTASFLVVSLCSFAFTTSGLIYSLDFLTTTTSSAFGSSVFCFTGSLLTGDIIGVFSSIGGCFWGLVFLEEVSFSGTFLGVVT